ncbi:hypothetical protein ACFXDE_01975 [Kitasatospora sp. NPDC059408]|uniref:hypothetical protein n=1 Tax=Kitasatospora sp. NPDC059408 TaxID=3346823 RepID=UPI0036BC59F6
MRPARFQQLLLDAAAALPGAAAKTFADAGGSKQPFGVVVEAGGRSTRWQIVVMSAPGEKWGDHPDPEPALGEKPVGPAMPAELNDLAAVEHGLVAALLAADAGEIAAVEVYSARPNPPVVGHGATVDLHDGSRMFINHVR